MKSIPDETLDTHAFLWFFIGDTSLSATARALIEDESNEKVFSVASLWEIAIKVSIGKLTLSASFDEIFPDQLTNNGIDLLGITPIPRVGVNNSAISSP